MTDLSYIEDLEKRTILLQEMFEEDSYAYKEFMDIISEFKGMKDDFEERVKKLEDSVYTLVRMMKQRAARDESFMEALENGISNDSCLRTDCTCPENRISPDYDQCSYGNSFNCY